MGKNQDPESGINIPDPPQRLPEAESSGKYAKILPLEGVQSVFFSMWRLLILTVLYLTINFKSSVSPNTYTYRWKQAAGIIFTVSIQLSACTD